MKAIYWTAIIVTLAALGSRLLGEEKKPSIEIRRVSPPDRAVAEEWERVTGEVDLLGVTASRIKQANWTWQISINVAEFVRKEPMESRLQDAVTAALKHAKGVKAVIQEDREVWLVQGDPRGEDLVRACSNALDQLAPDLRKYLKTLFKN